MKPCQEKENQSTQVCTVSNNELSTFHNQISGHSCMLKSGTNSKSVLKPFKRSEVDFYEVVTRQENCPLKKFIPAYYGLITLPKPQLEKIANEISSKTQLRPAQRTFGDLESKEEWMNSLYSKRFDEKKDCFFEIQDLTADITSPCVLDLKVGMVIHNLDDKPENYVSKPDNSTSLDLKFRIGGLQVKNPNTSTEYFKSKSWGRNIKSEEINSALALFFYDGQKLRRNLIKYFIDYLKEVHETVSKSTGFKFRCASLLLIYDGTIDDADERFGQELLKNKMRVGLIDFSKSVFGSDIQEPDKEFLEGVENFIKSLQSIQENQDVQPLF